MSAAQGLQLGMAFREQQMAKQKLAAEQRNVLSEEIDTRLQETAKQMQAAAKEMAAVRYSSPEEKKAEIEAQWNKQAGPIGASALQLYREAMRAGIKTQGDYENAKQILMIAAKLPDLKAQQSVEAGGKGAVAKAESEAKLGAEKEKLRYTEALNDPDAKATYVNSLGEPVILTTGGYFKDAAGKRVTDPSRLQGLTGIPTIQNVNQSTQIQDLQRGAQDMEAPSLGTQIIEDIKRSTGLPAAISKGASNVAGEYFPGTNPRLDAEQRINNFNQEVKFAFSRNPRFPVAEITKIQEELLPDPKAVFVDPEAEARKIPMLKKHLQDLNQADQRAIQYMSDSGQKEALDRMATRRTIIDLIGDIPTISADADSRINELEQKGLDNLSEEELKELESLLQ